MESPAIRGGMIGGSAGVVLPPLPEEEEEMHACVVRGSAENRRSHGRDKPANTRHPAAIAPSVSAYVPASSSRRPCVHRRSHSVHGATSPSCTASVSVDGKKLGAASSEGERGEQP